MTNAKGRKESSEHKEHDGIIVDLVAQQKENSFQVSLLRFSLDIDS